MNGPKTTIPLAKHRLRWRAAALASVSATSLMVALLLGSAPSSRAHGVTGVYALPATMRTLVPDPAEAYRAQRAAALDAYIRARRLTPATAVAVRAAANIEGVPWPLVCAVVEVESGWDPTARGSLGEIGLMQLMPPTAMGLAADTGVDAGTAWDPDVNLRLGAHLLGRLLRRYDGDTEMALRAYNAGEGAVNLQDARRYARVVLEHLAIIERGWEHGASAA